MLTNVERTIEEFSLAQRDDKIIVGLSGGADSVVLLHSLLKLGFEVKACHINHLLRGEESERDQAFVENICNKWNVPLEIRRVDVNSLVEKHKSVEQTARNARYEIFSSFNDCKVATGHNSNDNAETILINLCRGTGSKGLCGIPIKRGNIIRPLLFISREEINEYCSKNKIPFVTDSTNFQEDFTRNKIRKNIIPHFREINPSFLSVINRMSRNLTEENFYLDKIAGEIAQKAKNAHGYDVAVLKECDDVIIKRFILYEFALNNIEPNNFAIQTALEMIKSEKGKANIAKNYFIQVKNRNFHIFFEKQSYRIDKNN